MPAHPIADDEQMPELVPRLAVGANLHRIRILVHLATKPDIADGGVFDQLLPIHGYSSGSQKPSRSGAKRGTSETRRTEVARLGFEPRLSESESLVLTVTLSGKDFIRNA